MQEHELHGGALLEIIGRGERLNQPDGERERRHARQPRQRAGGEREKSCQGAIQFTHPHFPPHDCCGFLSPTSNGPNDAAKPKNAATQAIAEICNSNSPRAGSSDEQMRASAAMTTAA